MIAYLIKSGLCLALLLAFYHWVLEREKMHQFNRFYLLGSILFSFIVPFAVIYVEVAPDVVKETTVWLLQENQSALAEGVSMETTLDWTQYLFIGYAFVSLLMLIRFIKSLGDILLKIKRNEVIPYQKAKIVLVHDLILPHTFWNFIFINKEEYHSQKVEKELFTHELTHVTQKHTVDVLIVEALQVVLWFNPFFYPLKKAIQLNHEFLADDKVIASHHDIPKYQYLLLDKAAWKNKYYLASNLNYSLTKKRLLMMKTPNSKSTMLWKKLAIVPLVGGLIFLFADRVEAQTKKKKPEVIEVVETNSGASKRLMRLYQKLFKAAKKENVFKRKEVQLMKEIYSKMSEKQKKSVTNIKDILPPPPPRPKKILIEEKEELPPPPPLNKKSTKKAKTLVEKKKKLQKIAKVIEVIEKEKEMPTITEIKEIPEEIKEEKVELVEVREKIPQEEEIEIVEESVSISHPEIQEEYEVEELEKELKRLYKDLVKKKATFYLNGKKIPAKKVKKYFFDQQNKLKNIDVTKGKTEIVKVTLKSK
jgi:hypothetical protein